eukprot:6267585-Pyramimonas_sp.AAC.1
MVSSRQRVSAGHHAGIDGVGHYRLSPDACNLTPPPSRALPRTTLLTHNFCFGPVDGRRIFSRKGMRHSAPSAWAKG